VAGRKVILKKRISREKKWLFNDEPLSLPIQLRVMAGEEVQSIDHLHKTMHEYFYLLQGQMKISIDGMIYELQKDDLIVVEPGERHHIPEKSSDLVLLLLMPPPVPDDKIAVN
jgi:quercetin dioxygenase-like cupin family protein